MATRREETCRKLKDEDEALMLLMFVAWRRNMITICRSVASAAATALLGKREKKFQSSVVCIMLIYFCLVFLFFSDAVLQNILLSVSGALIVSLCLLLRA